MVLSQVYSCFIILLARRINLLRPALFRSIRSMLITNIFKDNNLQLN